MANQEHLDILKQGVKAWNDWREEHPKDHLDLTGANLWATSLRHFNLYNADLTGANLRGANLNGADLMGAILTNAILTYTNFTGAKVGWTTFGDLDLSTARGLETIDHYAPSTIGIDTIYRSGGNIPEVFLTGAGVPDIFIEYMRSLVGKPIEFYSCFISYSSKDQEFAQRLYNGW